MNSIPKDTTQRILKDVREMLKHPLTDHGIYYQHDEHHLLKGYAMIVGPSNTPYAYGYYFFEFLFPTDYPYCPPTVRYCTNKNNIRFHPNLYVNGKVCLSILNTWAGEKWSSCQSIQSVLLTLCSILTSRALTHEPGTHEESSIQQFDKIVSFANVASALIDVLQQDRNIYLFQFDIFYEQIQALFLKNYDAIVAHIHALMEQYSSPESVKLKNSNSNVYFYGRIVHLSILYNPPTLSKWLQTLETLREDFLLKLEGNNLEGGKKEDLIFL